jgi:hypothetical protein
MKRMFRILAEDSAILPVELRGDTRLPLSSKTDPGTRDAKLQALFEAMAGRGEFGADSILHSGGGLFADAEVIPLTPREIAQLIRVNEPGCSDVVEKSPRFPSTGCFARRFLAQYHYFAVQYVFHCL